MDFCLQNWTIDLFLKSERQPLSKARWINAFHTWLIFTGHSMGGARSGEAEATASDSCSGGRQMRLGVPGQEMRRSQGKLSQKRELEMLYPPPRHTCGQARGTKDPERETLSELGATCGWGWDKSPLQQQWGEAGVICLRPPIQAGADHRASLQGWMTTVRGKLSFGYSRFQTTPRLFWYLYFMESEFSFQVLVWDLAVFQNTWGKSTQSDG